MKKIATLLAGAAAIVCLPSIVVAGETYSVLRSEVHLPVGAPGDVDNLERFLSAPRTWTAMRDDLQVFGATVDDVGRRVVTGSGETALTFDGPARGYAKGAHAVKAVDGTWKTEIDAGVASSGDVITLRTAEGDAVRWHLVSQWLRGFDVKTFDLEDGKWNRVQRPHFSETDLRGTIVVPVGRTVGIVEADPDETDGRRFVVWQVSHDGHCDGECPGVGKRAEVGDVVQRLLWDQRHGPSSIR